MKFWLLLYLIINIVIFIYYYRKPNGVFQVPFLMAYTSIFVLSPQFLSIYTSPYYDKRLIPDLGFMMVTCNMALVAGFELFKRKIHFDTQGHVVGILWFMRIKWVVVLFTILGFCSIFM